MSRSWQDRDKVASGTGPFQRDPSQLPQPDITTRTANCRDVSVQGPPLEQSGVPEEVIVAAPSPKRRIVHSLKPGSRKYGTLTSEIELPTTRGGVHSSLLVRRKLAWVSGETTNSLPVSCSVMIRDSVSELGLSLTTVPEPTGRLAAVVEEVPVSGLNRATEWSSWQETNAGTANTDKTTETIPIEQRAPGNNLTLLRIW